MTQKELIALIQTIFEPLQAAGFATDLERFAPVLGRLLEANRVQSYEALEELRDLLLVDFTELPPEAGIGRDEWRETKVDFCRAAELYLDGKWQQHAPGTLH